MTKQLIEASGNTAWGFGSIYLLLHEQISFFLSVLIGLLTIIYLVYQIQKCIADTKFKRLETKVLEQEKKLNETDDES